MSRFDPTVPVPAVRPGQRRDAEPEHLHRAGDRRTVRVGARQQQAAGRLSTRVRGGGGERDRPGAQLPADDRRISRWAGRRRSCSLRRCRSSTSRSRRSRRWRAACSRRRRSTPRASPCRSSRSWHRRAAWCPAGSRAGRAESRPAGAAAAESAPAESAAAEPLDSRRGDLQRRHHERGVRGAAAAEPAVAESVDREPAAAERPARQPAPAE